MSLEPLFKLPTIFAFGGVDRHLCSTFWTAPKHGYNNENGSLETYDKGKATIKKITFFCFQEDFIEFTL